MTHESDLRRLRQRNQELRVRIESLLAQNAAMLEALEFYADESNYTGWTDPDYQWTGISKDYESPIEGDLGEIARQAIAQAEGK